VQDARFSGFRYDTIALTQSTDGGQSWSPLVRINPCSHPGARVDDRQAFTPAVHVGDEGTVTLTFYDFRNNTAVAVHGPLVGGEDAVGPPASEDCSRSAGWNEETRVTPASFDMRQAPFAGGYFTGDYEGLGFASSDGDAVGPASDVFVSYFSQLHVATRRAPCRACWRLRRTQADWDAPLGPGPGRIPRAECARPRRLGRPPPTRRAVAFGSPLPIFAVGLVL
jgi:hypothetical protein